MTTMADLDCCMWMALVLVCVGCLVLSILYWWFLFQTVEIHHPIFAVIHADAMASLVFNLLGFGISLLTPVSFIIELLFGLTVASYSFNLSSWLVVTWLRYLLTAHKHLVDRKWPDYKHLKHLSLVLLVLVCLLLTQQIFIINYAFMAAKGWPQLSILHMDPDTRKRMRLMSTVGYMVPVVLSCALSMVFYASCNKNHQEPGRSRRIVCAAVGHMQSCFSCGCHRLDTSESDQDLPYGGIYIGQASPAMATLSGIWQPMADGPAKANITSASVFPSSGTIVYIREAHHVERDLNLHSDWGVTANLDEDFYGMETPNDQSNTAKALSAARHSIVTNIVLFLFLLLALVVLPEVVNHVLIETGSVQGVIAHTFLPIFASFYNFNVIKLAFQDNLRNLIYYKPSCRRCLA